MFLRLLVLVLTFSISAVHAHTDNPFAQYIWKREGAAKTENLLHWNQGESFASLGIGHFIWYPRGVARNYEETFPDLLEFLSDMGYRLPLFLVERNQRYCPWPNRTVFMEARTSQDMRELHKFLEETIEGQAKFIWQRSLQKFEAIKAKAEIENNSRIPHNFAKMNQGIYSQLALVDYLNFKGDGLNPKERYQEQGWGLYQVLDQMDPEAPYPLEAFALTALSLLEKRVQNAPSSKNEDRFLAGWRNRVRSYLVSEQILEKMSTRELIGQLLIAHFQGNKLNQDAKDLLEEVHVGGIIYYNWANDLSSPEQVLNLSNSLQSHPQSQKIPLWICTDQEGGRVQQLKEGFTEFPGNAPLGRCADTALTQRYSEALAHEIAAVGINLNLAPVVDVNNNPKNPVIGIRSFSSDPKVVTEQAQAMIKGFSAKGVGSCLKHFPGHGNTHIDSHFEPPHIEGSYDGLMEVELIPFMALKDQTTAIMTGHLIVETFDKARPATFSKAILQDLLQQEIGYKGLIIADSIIMRAALRSIGASVEEATLLALQAGCDQVILGGKILDGKADSELTLNDVINIANYLTTKIEEGELPLASVKEKARRVLLAKERLGLFEPRVLSTPNLIDHEKLSLNTAERSTVVSKSSPQFFDIEKAIIVAPYQLKTSLLKALRKADLKLTVYYYNGLEPDDATLSKVSEGTEPLIIFTYNAWQNEKQLYPLHYTQNRLAAVIATASDEDVKLAGGANFIISTLSPSWTSIYSALKKLSPNL